MMKQDPGYISNRLSNRLKFVGVEIYQYGTLDKIYREDYAYSAFAPHEDAFMAGERSGSDPNAATGG